MGYVLILADSRDWHWDWYWDGWHFKGVSTEVTSARTGEHDRNGGVRLYCEVLLSSPIELTSENSSVSLNSVLLPVSAF